jgi:DNA topoisomerase VI subunit B
MKDKHPKSLKLSSGEEQLIEQMRQHPDIMERVQSILSMASSSGTTADEIEELLISEIQRLGHATIESWAVRTEQRLAEELKSKDSSAGVIKKKR